MSINDSLHNLKTVISQLKGKINNDLLLKELQQMITDNANDAEDTKSNAENNACSICFEEFDMCRRREVLLSCCQNKLCFSCFLHVLNCPFCRSDIEADHAITYNIDKVIREELAKDKPVLKLFEELANKYDSEIVKTVFLEKHDIDIEQEKKRPEIKRTIREVVDNESLTNRNPETLFYIFMHKRLAKFDRCDVADEMATMFYRPFDAKFYEKYGKTKELTGKIKNEIAVMLDKNDDAYNVYKLIKKKYEPQIKEVELNVIDIFDEHFNIDIKAEKLKHPAPLQNTEDAQVIDAIEKMNEALTQAINNGTIKRTKKNYFNINVGGKWRKGCTGRRFALDYLLKRLTQTEIDKLVDDHVLHSMFGPYNFYPHCDINIDYCKYFNEHLMYFI